MKAPFVEVVYRNKGSKVDLTYTSINDEDTLRALFLSLEETGCEVQTIVGVG
jgi:hypothetical protein